MLIARGKVGLMIVEYLSLHLSPLFASVINQYLELGGMRFVKAGTVL